MRTSSIPSLSFWQIINMNVGFFGIQYSFGLQQTAINPLYTFLHAKPEELPLLNLAGPMTGLLVQPIIGAMSDRTWHPRWGRRKPYFLVGAIMCSLALFAFPFSKALWMAVGPFGSSMPGITRRWSPIEHSLPTNCPLHSEPWAF
jgi:maltose/moltooligosaccharide transporter